MKIVDEKGRLFGKLNLIDLLVILVLVFIVVAVVWKVAAPKEEAAVQGEALTVRYEVLCTEVDPETCQSAQKCVGSQLLSNEGLHDGHITDCEIEPCMEMVSTPDGVMSVENPNLHNLRFTIEVHPSVVRNSYSVGKQELRIGNVHTVKSTSLEIREGTITSMEVLEAND